MDCRRLLIYIGMEVRIVNNKNEVVQQVYENVGVQGGYSERWYSDG